MKTLPHRTFLTRRLDSGAFTLVLCWAVVSTLPALLTASTASAASNAPTLWEPPLDGPLRVVESYALPDGPYRAGHRGIDIPATAGAAVHAPSSGTVTFVGAVVDRPVLSLRLDAHTVVSFEPIASSLRKGDRLARGEAIGRVAAGGHCSGSCLHIGVRIDDEYANPLRFLQPRPILLPW